MRIISKIFVAFALLMLWGCSTEPSLQQYYVKHQNDSNFVVIDVSTNMFINNIDDLPKDSKAALSAIHRVNILALPLNGKNKKQFEMEQEEVLSILHSGAYKLLFKVKYSDKLVELRYLGEGQSIDEMVVMAGDDEKGFIIARLLGDDMKPKTLANLMKSFVKGDINADFDQLPSIFKQKNH